MMFAKFGNGWSTARGFFLKKNCRALRATFLLIIFAGLAYSGLPKRHTSLFGIHAWRKTQTFAVYDCLRKQQAITAKMKCLIAQPRGFDDKRYVGLEFPLFQIVDYLMAPGQSVENYYSILPMLSGAVLLAILGAVFFLHEGPISFLVFTGAIWNGLIASSVMIFFLGSYQPDLFSFTLMACGAYYGCHFDMKKTGMVFIVLGILSKPSLLPIGLALLPFFPSMADRFWPYSKNIATMTLLVSLPIAVYYGTILIYVLMGYPTQGALTLIYQKGQSVDFMWIMKSHLERVDKPFLFVSVHVLILAFIRMKKHMDWRHAISYSFFTISVTILFVFLFGGFQANTYYSIVFLGWLCLLIVLTYGYLGSPQKMIGKFHLFLIPIIMVSQISPTEDYTALQLKSREVSCNPGDLGSYGEILKSEKEVFLNCPGQDPHCRAVLGYSGVNLFYKSLISPNTLKKLKKKEAFFTSCGLYNQQLEMDKKISGFVLENSRLVYSKNDWRVFKF